MKKTKLSIAIPTYNRSTYIEKVILQFEEQILETNENVNIYISDNSDNDLTSNLILSMQKKFDNIYYSKNSENIGFDRNVLNAVTYANSEYIWIFGDDDEIEKNALATTLEYINKYPKVDYFLVNSLPCEPIAMKVLGSAIVDSKSDIYFDNSTEALEQISWYSTFIGAYIVKKEVWESCDSKKYLDTLFVHVGKLFESAITNKSHIYFMAEPMIKYRTNNATWSKRLVEIQLLLWPSTINRLPDTYPEKSKLVAIKSVSNRFITFGSLYNLKKSKLLNIFQLNNIIIPFMMQKKELYRIKIGIYYMFLYICPLPFLEFLKKIKHLALKSLHA